jgi:hypothetical protein
MTASEKKQSFFYVQTFDQDILSHNIGNKYLKDLLFL